MICKIRLKWFKLGLIHLHLQVKRYFFLVLLYCLLNLFPLSRFFIFKFYQIMALVFACVIFQVDDSFEFRYSNTYFSGTECCKPVQTKKFVKPVFTSNASISINIRSLCASEDSRDITINIYACIECIFVSIPSCLADEEDYLLLLALVVTLRRRRRQKRRSVKPKRFWVREIFRNRKRCGEFHNLVRELRLGDRELYFR